ncbi:MAG TPA: hypothetical protein VFH90_04410 [Candidatus Limnocylindria bacterium]|nr:hypothetical protein [Candidatus Limnocylindria bacterium]
MAVPEPTTPAARAYERTAGIAAILAGVGGIVYSIAFLGGIVLEWAPQLGAAVSASALMTGGLLGVTVLVAVYGRLKDTAPSVALLGFVLAAIGAGASTIHGGYMLANAIHPPLADVLADAAIPNPVDPRGLMTFGVSGLALLVLMLQSRRSGTLPVGLATLGAVVGIMLVIIYLGRLTIVVPTNPLVAVPAALTGLVLSPAFYILLGLELRRR